MKSTFEDVDKIELTAEHIELFKKLKKDPDFKSFQEFVEQEILKKVYALAVGTAIEDEMEYLKGLRGFARSWKSIISRINREYDKKEN